MYNTDKMKKLTFNQIQLRLLTLLFLLFSVAVVGYRYFIELPKLEQSITKITEKELETLQFSISGLFSVLNRVTFDYAIWTPSYDFMENPNQAYIDENFVNNTFVSLEVDGIFYFDKHLNVKLYKGFHHQNFIDLEFDFYDFEKYPQNKAMLPVLNQVQGVNEKFGFIDTNHGAAMYSAIQIKRSDLSGANEGVIVMLQLLEASFIEKLSRYTGTELTLNSKPEAIASAKPNWLLWSDELRDIEIRPFSRIMLPGSDGECVALLTMDHSEPNKPKLINQTSVVFIALVSIFMYLVYRLVANSIIIPVKQLAFEIKRRDKLDNYEPLDTQLRVHELASVAQNMNQLLLTISEQNKILKEQVITDQLTKILNRRGLLNDFQRHKDLCVRKGIGFIIVMIDIDHFKKYNDALGHPQGDRALQQVAQILRSQCQRCTDTCARYGGEEFTIIFSEMTRTDLEKKLQDIMRLMRSVALPHPRSDTANYITVSAGALMVTGCDVIDYKLPGKALFQLADEALYEAKENGRNGYKIRVLADAE